MNDKEESLLIQTQGQLVLFLLEQELYVSQTAHWVDLEQCYSIQKEHGKSLDQMDPKPTATCITRVKSEPVPPQPGPYSLHTSRQNIDGIIWKTQC